MSTIYYSPKRSNGEGSEAIVRTSAQQLNQRGDHFYALGQYADAIENYSEAIRFSPNESLYLYNRAVCYQNLQKFGQATIDYQQAIELNSAFAYCSKSLDYCKRRFRENQPVGTLTQGTQGTLATLENEPTAQHPVSGF